MDKRQQIKKKLLTSQQSTIDWSRDDKSALMIKRLNDVAKRQMPHYDDKCQGIVDHVFPI